MKDNIQKKIKRNRPPRVHITYDLETEGAIIKKELPCVIALIADLTGERDEEDLILPYIDRKFTYLDIDNINDVMEFCKTKVSFHLGLDPEKKESFAINFKTIRDFHPDFLLENIPIIKERFDKRKKLSDLSTRLGNNSKLFEGAEKIVKKQGSKDDALKEYKFISEDQKAYLTELFTIFEELEPVEEHPFLTINKSLETLDSEINTLLNQALHDPNFKKIEGTWMGINYFLKNTELGEQLKFRVFNASMAEVHNDITRALDFDQSLLFKRLYEEEYGTFGGNPYTCLMIDFFMNKDPNSVIFLQKMSEIAAASHIPTILSVQSSFFDLESYELINKPRAMYKIFDSPEFIKFKNFRDRDESRYISFVLPRFMHRVPFGSRTDPVENTNFEEEIINHEDFAWSNSVYAYGAKIAQSFTYYNWFASIIGPENGGIVSDLPIYIYKDKPGDMVIKCPTEVAITDRREKELSELGFISLCHCKDQDYSVFFSGQSVNKPQKFNLPQATSNARLSARFQYILNCSRFAHYIKCIMRDKIGSFTTKTEIQSYLTIWLKDYILEMDEAPQEIKAQYPLREASVIINDIEGKPGCYDAIIYLRPHFQMEELTVSLRLVARIPVQGGAA